MRRPLAPLTERRLARGVRELCRRDRHLADIVARFGPPPLWGREPGFATLVQIILEQQVSLASGRAAHARLLSVARVLSPERVAELGDRALRRSGLTRQKSAYIRGLAKAIVRGEFDVQRLQTLDDDRARAELTSLRGIGAWTADIYLLMALGRPDVWPRRDLALEVAVREAKHLHGPSKGSRLLEIVEAWRPWRAVAARILWHYYLSTPKRRSPRGNRRLRRRA